MPPALQVVLFRRDLRIDDHEPLALAAKRGPVLPLYIVDPAQIASPTFDARHWTFIRAGLIELRRRLFTLGQPLIVRVGAVDETLEEIRQETPFKRIWLHDDPGGDNADGGTALLSWATARKVKLSVTAIDGIEREPEERRDIVERWNAFAHAAPISAPARLAPATGVQPGPIPDHADLGLDPDLCHDALRGGEQAAKLTLSAFLARRAEQYGDDLIDPGGELSSKLSPYLAWGNLSSRQIVQATNARLRELRGRPMDRRGAWETSLAAFVARLQRRAELLQAFVDDPTIDHVALDKGIDGLRSARPDGTLFAAWAAGLTGYPMIDAAMRALRETGRLSYRMRAMLVSFAAFDLWLDWRTPGLHLARLALDYEPAIHWRHVQLHAGVGGQPALHIYNPTKQGLEHDPDGAFVRHWVPELARVPTSFIHTPWLLPEGMQESLGCVIGRHYPAPIVDHATAARDAQRRVHAAREQSATPAMHSADEPSEPVRMALRASRVKRPQREKPTQLSFPVE